MRGVLLTCLALVVVLILGRSAVAFRFSKLFDGDIPSCEAPNGFVTDSGVNDPAGLGHRLSELHHLAAVAAYSGKSLIDFKPRFAEKHEGKYNDTGMWWSSLVDMDGIVIHGVDECKRFPRNVHCRLPVSSSTPFLSDVTLLPATRSHHALFNRKNNPRETAPACYRVESRIAWSQFILNSAAALVDFLGEPPLVVAQLRMGDKAHWTLPGTNSTFAEANAASNVITALSRHGIQSPGTIYVSTNPGSSLDIDDYISAGFRVVRPEDFPLFKDEPSLRSNVAQFAVESAAAETLGVWRVTTEKTYAVNPSKQICLAAELRHK